MKKKILFGLAILIAFSSQGTALSASQVDSYGGCSVGGQASIAASGNEIFVGGLGRGDSNWCLFDYSSTQLDSGSDLDDDRGATFHEDYGFIIRAYGGPLYDLPENPIEGDFETYGTQLNSQSYDGSQKFVDVFANTAYQQTSCNQITQWSLSDGSQTGTITLANSNGCENPLLVTRNYIFTMDSSSIYTYDRTDGSYVDSFSTGYEGSYRGMAVNPNTNNFMIVGSSTVYEFDIGTNLYKKPLPPPPKPQKIECQVESSWKTCDSDFQFNGTLQKVNVTVDEDSSTSDQEVTDVQVKINNTYTGYQYRDFTSATSSYTHDGVVEYTVDYTDFNLNESGPTKFTAKTIGNYGAESYNSSDGLSEYGTLNPVMTKPETDIKVRQYDTFQMKGYVECNGPGQCGQVQSDGTEDVTKLWADPLKTGEPTLLTQIEGTVQPGERKEVSVTQEVGFWKATQIHLKRLMEGVL